MIHLNEKHFNVPNRYINVNNFIIEIINELNPMNY